MSQQGRSEAKRLRRIKRKQNSSNDSARNRISAAGLTIVGGGTLTAIAVALGVNAFSGGGPVASGENSPSMSPQVPPSLAPSETPSPSNSTSYSPNYSSTPSAKPSSSASAAPSSSPGSSPSSSPSTSASPSPSASQSPAVQQGSYYDAGRYGSGYYSTAYDVAFSSPMFMAGSGSYYGVSGYDAAIDSPSGYYSQGGWNGSGFYESGYYDLSGNTGYWGSWDGSGITHQYGAGAYYGVSGYSNPIHEARGSYYASGFAGAGHYASSTSYDYIRVIGNFESYDSVTAVMGDGTYYGLSGTSEPVAGLTGSYYSLGQFGAGYYSTGYYSCGYPQTQPTGASEWNYFIGKVGRQTYYGFSPNATPINGPEGTPKNDGYAGAGYYEPESIYDSPYQYGKGTYYGTNGYGSPVSPPPGSWYSSGNYGSGYYSDSGYDPNWGGIGTGTYYGVSGSSTPIQPG